MINAEYTITDLNKRIYNFAFDYLKKKYVKVSSKNITTGVITNCTYGVHYVVVDKTIELLRSVGAVGDVLRIVRETSTSEQIVSWNDASILKASDMSLSQIQQLHILEEYGEYISTYSLSLNTNELYDAKHTRIINLASPQVATDAVNRGYVDSMVGTLTSAQNSASAAQNSATSAQASATSAQNSATSAQNSATSAQASASAAQNSASAAQNSASAAQNSASSAQSWAVGSSGDRPEGSSKYWAETSKSYAEQVSITGNAVSATKLHTARKINGVSFDGTTDITVKAEANGGNAATIGGKYATDFAPSGFGLGTSSVSITENINMETFLKRSSTQSGFYRSGTITDLPNPIDVGYYLYVAKSVDVNDAGVLAIKASSETVAYHGSLINGVWSGWKQIAATNSPSFVGTPTAPTPGSTDNSTQVATTAFVQTVSKATGGIVASSLAQNGWVKFANGLILQWGVGMTDQYGTLWVTFPISFTYPAFSASGIHSGLDTTTCFIGSDYYLNTGCVFKLRRDTDGVSSAGWGIRWFAIGV